MKVYKQSWRSWFGRFFLVLFFLGIGVFMLFFLTALEIKALGLFSLLMGISVGWLSIKTGKDFGIRIDGAAIVFPSFTWWGRYIGKRVSWKEVLAVYTLSEYSSRGTYVIPQLQTGDKDFDRAINQGIKKGKKGTPAGAYLDYLKGTSQMFRVPRGIENYHDLLRDIIKRAARASIDDDTKRRAEGEECRVLLSDGTRRVLRVIFPRGLAGKKQMKRGRSIVFIDKPAPPSWLILISLFSFVIAGLLACRNYVLLGKPQKYGVMGIVMLAGLIAAAIIYLYSSSDFINALIWINLMAGAIMAFLQHPDYIEWEIRQSIKKKQKRGPRKTHGTRKKKKAKR